MIILLICKFDVIFYIYKYVFRKIYSTFLQGLEVLFLLLFLPLFLILSICLNYTINNHLGIRTKMIGKQIVLELSAIEKEIGRPTDRDIEVN